MDIAYLDTFKIDTLDTSLLPSLSLNVLTLLWDNITVTCKYELLADVESDMLQGPVFIDGKGDAT